MAAALCPRRRPVLLGGVVALVLLCAAAVYFRRAGRPLLAPIPPDWRQKAVWVADPPVKEQRATKALPEDNHHLLALSRTSAELTIGEKLEHCSHSLDISRSEANLSAAVEKTGKFLAILKSIIPPTFLSSYKSPCWTGGKLNVGRSAFLIRKLLLDGRKNFTAAVAKIDKTLKKLTRNKPALQCLPYFYIVGFPKSGTTSLHKALSQHRETSTPYIKEPQFWNNHARAYSSQYLAHPSSIKLALLLYLSHFKVVGENKEDKITYDPTAFTAVDATIFEGLQDFCTTPALISAVTPNAKFIFIMRNPVDRLFSNYLFACSQRYGSNTSKWPFAMRKPDENFHKEALSTVQSFNACLEKMSLTECVNINRFTDKGLQCGKVGMRLTVSLYYVHITKWLLYFPRENFLFLRTEDLSTHSQGVFEKVAKFLGISSVDASTAKSWFEKPVNTQSKVMHSSDSFSVLPETRRALGEFYQPYNAMLADITGDNHFLWTDS